MEIYCNSISRMLCATLLACAWPAAADEITITESTQDVVPLVGVLTLTAGSLVLCEGKANADSCDNKGISDIVNFLSDPIKGILPSYQMRSDFEPADEKNPPPADSTLLTLMTKRKYIPET